MKLSTLILVMVLLPMAAGFITWIVACKGKDTLANVLGAVTVVIECALCFVLMNYVGKNVTIYRIFTVDIHFQVKPIQFVLTALACYAWLLATLFSVKTENLARFRMFSLMSLGMTVGAFLAADFVTLVVYFVIMSVVNWFIIMHNNDNAAYNAGNSYFGSFIISTMFTMMGMFMMHHVGESLSYATLAEVVSEVGVSKALYTAGVFITIGYLTNAAVWPFHTWQSKSYAAAPAVGSAVLASVVSKVGVFGVCLVAVTAFPADAKFGMFLIIAACVTMLAGGVLAIFATDMKKLIANVSMAQTGFILLALGLTLRLGTDGAVAAKGAVMQTVSAVITMLALCLCAADVENSRSCSCLNAVKGAGKGKAAVLIAFIVAVLGVVGIPVFSGFAGLSAIYVSAGTLCVVQYAFVVSLGLVLAALLKLFVVLFVDKGEAKAEKTDAVSAIVLLVCAAVIVIAASAQTMEKITSVCLPFFGFEAVEFEVDYMFIAKEILFAAIFCVILAGRLFPKTGEFEKTFTEKLDIEEGFYRPLFMTVLPYIGGFCARLAGSVFDWIVSACDMVIKRGNENIAAKNEDDKFAVYPKDMETSRGTASTLAYGLALAGMVLVATFAWVLLRL